MGGFKLGYIQRCNFVHTLCHTLISSFVALSMNTIVMLRVLMVVSSVCYVINYYFFPVSVLWLDVGSEAPFALVNLFMISVLLRKKIQTDIY